jgi:hypothetical protein
MRKHLRAFAAAGLLLVAGIVAADAQPFVSTTNPRQPEPRLLQWQQTAYIRFVFNITTNAAQGCSTNNCVVKVGSASLPYNAVPLRATVQVVTAVNGTTTDVLSIGTTSANANEIASSCNVHALGTVACTMAANSSGSTPTGATTAQSGSNGGFDLYVKYTNTGGVGTLGQVIVILEFAMPNDGTCTLVPAGATAGAC